MSDVSLLDIDTKAKVRTMWMQNMSITDICNTLGISTGTWDSYYWLNKNGFRDFVNDIKREYFLKGAERVSAEVLSQEAEGNAKLLAIKQKESEFLRETLGKDLGYSKRPDSVNINVNKNEPLDDKQRELLNKLLRGEAVDVPVVITNVKEPDIIEEKEPVRIDTVDNSVFNNII